MATTTITRTTWTDDDGTGRTGSIINNAELQLIYDKVDALIAGDITWGDHGTYAAAKHFGFSDGYFSRVGANNAKFWNGTSLGQLDLGTLTLSPALAVASGGTGAVSFTANRVLVGNGTSAVQTFSGMTDDGTTLTAHSNTFTASATAIAGTLAVSGAGSTMAVFSAASASDNRISLTNTTSGAAAHAYFRMAAGTNVGGILAFSQGFSTSGLDIASSFHLFATGAGGLTLSAQDAAGVIRFCAGGTGVDWGINAAGDFTFGASAHIADSSGTPTVTPSAGSATIAGTDYAWVVTITSGSPSTVQVNFGHTWSNNPVCVAIGNGAGNNAISAVGTTSVTVTVGVGDTVIYGLCRGY